MNRNLRPASSLAGVAFARCRSRPSSSPCATCSFARTAPATPSGDTRETNRADGVAPCFSGLWQPRSLPSCGFSLHVPPGGHSRLWQWQPDLLLEWLFTLAQAGAAGSATKSSLPCSSTRPSSLATSRPCLAASQTPSRLNTMLRRQSKPTGTPPPQRRPSLLVNRRKAGKQLRNMFQPRHPCQNEIQPPRRSRPTSYSPSSHGASYCLRPSCPEPLDYLGL